MIYLLLFISLYTTYFLLVGLFSKVTSSSGMHETKMGGVVIQVVTGDITKETTDVIVNSTNKTFNLKTGTSNLTSVSPEVPCFRLNVQQQQQFYWFYQ